MEAQTANGEGEVWLQLAQGTFYWRDVGDEVEDGSGFLKASVGRDKVEAIKCVFQG